MQLFKSDFHLTLRPTSSATDRLCMRSWLSRLPHPTPTAAQALPAVLGGQGNGQDSSLLVGTQPCALQPPHFSQHLTALVGFLQGWEGGGTDMLAFPSSRAWKLTLAFLVNLRGQAALQHAICLHSCSLSAAKAFQRTSSAPGGTQARAPVIKQTGAAACCPTPKARTGVTYCQHTSCLALWDSGAVLVVVKSVCPDLPQGRGSKPYRLASALTCQAKGLLVLRECLL